MAFLSEEEIGKLGFKSVGAAVKLSDKASFYGPEHISIGDYSRIDDFCVLSAAERGIAVGRYVHLSASVCLIGRGRIEIGDLTALSARVSVFSSTDDFSGEYLTNPTVDPQFTNVHCEDVSIRKHVIVGAHSVVLPGVTLEEGAAVGALSLVKTDCPPFSLYAGVPAKFIKLRSRQLASLEKRFLGQ